MISIESWSDDRSRVIYRVFDGSQTDYWLLHDNNTDSLLKLGPSRADIPQSALGRVIPFEYAARDGLTISALLTVPPQTNLTDTTALPIVVMPHGGPSAYDRYDFDWLAQFFANRGYLVLQPNFRGSDGVGDAFEQAGNGEWGRKMQDDVSDGLLAMVSAGYADPDRACIVGASYGGYSALAGGAFTPDLYACVAAIAPVTDLNDMLQTARSSNGRSHWVVSYWENVLANGEADRQTLSEVSPVDQADAYKAPVLLIHGEDDTVVEFKQSRDMQRALKRADKSVELIKLRGGDHWLSDSTTRLQTLIALEGFVASHIGTASQTSPSE